MKVELVKDCDLGTAGLELSGPEVWRLCFPTKGMKARPTDHEAVERVRADIATVKGPTRARLEDQMTKAGTYPYELTPVDLPVQSTEEAAPEVAVLVKEPEETPVFRMTIDEPVEPVAATPETGSRRKRKSKSGEDEGPGEP